MEKVLNEKQLAKLEIVSVEDINETGDYCLMIADKSKTKAFKSAKKITTYPLRGIDIDDPDEAVSEFVGKTLNNELFAGCEFSERTRIDRGTKYYYID